MSSLAPLRGGERLARLEFHRRYEAMPDLKKAELIEGVVYLTPRVAFAGHGGPMAELIGFLGVYTAHTPNVRGGAHSSLLLDDENEPQPDGLLLIDPRHGGQARIVDGFLTRPPELLADVSPPGEKADRSAWLRVYRRHAVQEYILWRVEERRLDWFRLRGGEYDLLPVVDGVIRSEVFPGLWLDVAALIAGDLNRLMSTLQQGVASPEHAAFVASLPPA